MGKTILSLHFGKKRGLTPGVSLYGPLGTHAFSAIFVCLAYNIKNQFIKNSKHMY